jgi:hypothetical protein
MPSLEEFYFNSRSSVVKLELFDITHPNFTKPYYLVRNKADGVTVTLETGATRAYEYYPLAVQRSGSQDDLDFGVQLDVGDVGDTLPQEVDAVFAAPGGRLIRPLVTYRVYRSDDLSAPMFGPIVLEVAQLPFDSTGSSILARAPRLNNNRTGEYYNMDRFPGLRGFV